MRTGLTGIVIKSEIYLWGFLLALVLPLPGLSETNADRWKAQVNAQRTRLLNLKNEAVAKANSTGDSAKKAYELGWVTHFQKGLSELQNTPEKDANYWGAAVQAAQAKPWPKLHPIQNQFAPAKTGLCTGPACYNGMTVTSWEAAYRTGIKPENVVTGVKTWDDVAAAGKRLKGEGVENVIFANHGRTLGDVTLTPENGTQLGQAFSDKCLYLGGCEFGKGAEGENTLKAIAKGSGKSAITSDSSQWLYPSTGTHVESGSNLLVATPGGGEVALTKEPVRTDLPANHAPSLKTAIEKGRAEAQQLAAATKSKARESSPDFVTAPEKVGSTALDLPQNLVSSETRGLNTPVRATAATALSRNIAAHSAPDDKSGVPVSTLPHAPTTVPAPATAPVPIPQVAAQSLDSSLPPLEPRNTDLERASVRANLLEAAVAPNPEFAPTSPAPVQNRKVLVAAAAAAETKFGDQSAALTAPAAFGDVPKPPDATVPPLPKTQTDSISARHGNSLSTKQERPVATKVASYRNQSGPVDLSGEYRAASVSASDLNGGKSGQPLGNQYVGLSNNLLLESNGALSIRVGENGKLGGGTGGQFHDVMYGAGGEVGYRAGKKFQRITGDAALADLKSVLKPSTKNPLGQALKTKDLVASAEKAVTEAAAAKKVLEELEQDPNAAKESIAKAKAELEKLTEVATKAYTEALTADKSAKVITSSLGGEAELKKMAESKSDSEKAKPASELMETLASNDWEKIAKSGVKLLLDSLASSDASPHRDKEGK